VRQLYNFNNRTIECAESIRDLGVIVDGLTFVNNVVSKAYAFCYVRPILEYASSVWKPHLLKHINALERVQRHFTKRITVLRHLSYEERLACLKLDTLECRRLKADLTLYYKIMHNLTLWPIDRYFNMAVHSRHSRLTEQ